MVQKARTIHPADAQDERLAALPLSTAYTYAYLPTVLDDDGRAKDQAAVLNGYLWPLRADEHPTSAMADDLDALAAAGLLCRYTVDGVAYLHLLDWASRQKTGRPVRSTLPPCPTHDLRFDDVLAETFGKVADQVSSFLGEAAANLDEAKIRDSVARIVEDVTFMVDAEKAAAYGEKVREFLSRSPGASGWFEPGFRIGGPGRSPWRDEGPGPMGPRDEESGPTGRRDEGSGPTEQRAEGPEAPDDPWGESTDDPRA